MKDARKVKTATAASQLDVEKGETNKKAQTSSTLRKQQKEKLKKMGMSTKPKVILDTFCNPNLAPAEWETLTDQSLSRVVHKVADESRGRNQSMGERDEIFDQPTGASDDSSMKDTGVKRNSRTNKDTQTNEE